MGNIEKHKALVEKYSKKPANIPFLCAPRCNVEVFNMLNSKTSQKDAQIQKLQTKMLTGMTPLIKAMEINKDKQVRDLLKDSFQLFAQAHMDQNNDRRNRIRPELGQLKHLAYKENDITENLFGDNLEAESKKAETSAKLSEALKLKHNKRK